MTLQMEGALGRLSSVSSSCRLLKVGDPSWEVTMCVVAVVGSSSGGAVLCWEGASRDIL